MHRLALAALFLSACTSDRSEPPAEASKSAEKPPASYWARLDRLGLQIELPTSAALPTGMSGIYSIDDPALKLDVMAAEKEHPTTVEEGKRWVRESKPLELAAETLPDGWILTYRNRTQLGELYSLTMRRDIDGKGVICRSSAMSPALITAAIEACKSIKP